MWGRVWPYVPWLLLLLTMLAFYYSINNGVWQHSMDLWNEVTWWWFQHQSGPSWHMIITYGNTTLSFCGADAGGLVRDCPLTWPEINPPPAHFPPGFYPG